MAPSSLAPRSRITDWRFRISLWWDHRAAVCPGV